MSDTIIQPVPPFYFRAVKAVALPIVVIATAVFALYTGATGPFESAVQRGIFVLLLLPTVFLLVPSGLMKPSRHAEAILSLALAAASIGVMAYTLYHYKRLYAEPFIGTLDIWVGMCGIALVLETVRRTVGLAITIILVLFILFALAGPQVPFQVLRHGGLDVETIASLIFFGTDGVFGTPIAVCATFIMIIMLLGAFLTHTGAAEMFMNLAKILAGRFVGGPAKIAVVGSAMMGMITGATVANVATTGAVTIPMMKRAGYNPRFAGAVEALASSGGQLMPPIMGAAAFIMIEFLDISYTTLLFHAIIPAVLFFFCLMVVVHVRSVREGMSAIPRAAIPRFGEEMKRRGHMLLPIAVLIYMLSQGQAIMYAAFLSVATAIVVCQLRSDTRLSLLGYYKAFEANIAALVPLVAICAGAGIMIGTLTATGLNLKITYLIDFIGGGVLLPTLIISMFACLILGMGLPTVAAYIVLATLVPASLINMGLPPVAAHMFIFYFAILSAVTPPVCTGAFVAAGIANANPMQTGIQAMKMAGPVFLLPYAFVYNPSLLAIGEWQAIALHVFSAGLGLWFWALGAEGYLRHMLGPAPRAVFVVSGILLIWPDPLLSALGFAIGGLCWVLVVTHHRRSQRSMETPDGNAREPAGLD